MSRTNRRRKTRPLARDASPSHRIWPWLILAVFTLTIVAASSTEYGLVRLFKLRAAHERLLEQNRELEADNSRLEASVRRLREDRYAVERIAREELGLVKAGEIVYQVAP